MTTIYIPFKDGIPANSNFYSAYVGFREMGFETAPYFAPDTLDGVGREDIVVGGIGACQSVLARFGVDVPTINYPPSLSRFLGRKVRVGNVERMIAESQGEPLFVKSLHDKQFTGKVVRNVGDIAGWLGGTEEVDAIARWLTSGASGAVSSATARCLMCGHTMAIGALASMRLLSGTPWRHTRTHQMDTVWTSV